MSRCIVSHVEDEGPWPIDDFARLAGTTVRNVRLYQERGLVPPPERVGRRATYGPVHLRRLRLVLTLLERGYPLAAARELIEAWEANRTLGDVLGFEEALAESFTPEEPRRYTLAELQELFPDDVDGRGLVRALEIGLLEVVEDGFVAPVPSLIEVGAELVADGAGLDDVLDVAAAIEEASRRVAKLFVRLYLRSVWEPFVAAGKPDSGWSQLTVALERQRAVWPRAVLPALAHALDQEVVDAAHEVVAREVAEGPPT